MGKEYFEQFQMDTATPSIQEVYHYEYWPSYF
jgi:hypothetical protein